MMCYRLVILLIVIILLNACSNAPDELKDLKDYIKAKRGQENASRKQNINLNLQWPQTIQYQANALRAPFENKELLATGKAPSANPLQAHPLNMLRFVGTVTQGTKISAYVLTPDNAIFQVKVGDVLGLKYGKIVKISQHEIVVIEQDFEGGKIIERPATLQLKE